MKTMRAVVTLAVLTLALGVTGAIAIAQEATPGAQAARPPQKIVRPPLFFHEDWKFDMAAPPNKGPEQEHPIDQGDIASPNVELHVYGDKTGPFIVSQASDNIIFAWTGLCTANCAVTLRDKNNYVDLTGLAKLRWRTRENGFHLVHPIIKLADGTWLIGDHATGYSTDWVETEIALVDVRWRHFDAENVVEARDGKWADNPDLSKVDEIGFTDLMRGSGHGNGGGTRVDWIEVQGNPVPHGAGAQNASK